MKTTKVVSLLTAFAMLTGTAAMLPMVQDSAIAGSATSVPVFTGTYEQLTFESNNHEITITGCESDAAEVVIPAEIDGVPVTAIGRSAFADCSELKSVVIAEGVERIGAYAFENCISLTSVTLPSTIKKIETDVFRNCLSFTDIYYSATIVDWNEIEFDERDDQFWSNILLHCALDIENSTEDLTEDPTQAPTGDPTEDSTEGGTEGTYEMLTYVNYGDHIVITGGKFIEGEVEIPAEIDDVPVTSIEKNAFSGCYNLTDIIIPDSVTSIGDFAFWCCSGLISIAIPDSVRSIGESAFMECSALTSIIIPEGVTSIEQHAFYGCSSLTSIDFPDSLTSVKDHAFHDCINLTSVIIPDGVTSIGTSAFLRCSNLTSVTIPDSVTSIGGLAFSETPWMKEEQEKDPFVVVNGILIDGSVCEGDVVVPDGVTSIGDSAFCLGNKITGITIPDAVTSIETSAFSHCINLTDITLPSSVTSIEPFTFSDCKGLANVTIPESITNIETNAFFLCESLTDVYYAGTEAEWKAIVIDPLCNDALLAANIHYADGEKSTEPTDSPEPEYVSTDCYEYYRYSDHIELGNIFGGGDVVIPAEIDGLPVTSAEGANCVEDLTSIVLPDTMTEIPYFYRCDSLETIVLPKNLTAIGDWSFVECSNLKNIVIPDSVTSIGAAFEALPNLKTINIPANVKTIADGFIANCENLETIELSPDNPYFVFENGILMDAERTRAIVCLPKAAPKKIVLPDTVTSIGEFAFAGCNALQELKIPDSVTHIGAAAFWRCESLKELYIPEGVTELTSKPTEGGSYDTFEECIALEKLYLPATLTSTTCETFSGCANLKEIYFTGTQEQWDAIRIMNDRGEFEIGKYYVGYAYDEEQDRYVELEFDPTMHYNYVPESPVSLGNLNGDNSIDATDAAFLLSAAAAAGAGGESGLTAEQTAAADLNGDGAFDASDAALILMYAAYSGAGGDLSITDYLAQL